MKSDFKKEVFIATVNNRVSQTNFRDAANTIGLSASSLNRLANNIKMPNVDEFARICKWLEVSPSRFFDENIEEQALSTLDQIEILLRTDNRLSDEAATALMRLIEISYQNVSKK